MVKIHGAQAYLEDLQDKEKEKKKKGTKAQIERAKKELMHDYILNFIGTLFGWLSAYYYFFYRLGNKIEPLDLLFIFIVFVGITGYLPHIIVNKGFKP
jgi:hypothetical protein